MEKEGLSRVITMLSSHGVTIENLVTDRHRHISVTNIPTSTTSMTYGM